MNSIRRAAVAMLCGLGLGYRAVASDRVPFPGPTNVPGGDIKFLDDYDALRAYRGNDRVVFVTGHLGNVAVPGIAGFFFLDHQDITSSDNSGTVIVSREGHRWKRQYSGGVNIQWFGARMDGSSDVTGLQAAIDFVKERAIAQGRAYGLPRVEIPGGRCHLPNTVTTYPWITIVALGPVLLDFSSIEASKPGIVCNNNTTIGEDALKFPANHAPFLSGEGGAIAILGPGRSVSKAAALKVGNFSAGGKPFRDVRISNVVISGWGFAQEFGTFDTYLFQASNCRFEKNIGCIKTGSGPSKNSGERMDWVSCTFAGSDVVLAHDTDSFDANFIGCSFDFNEDIVRFGKDSKYCAVRFDRPYFESFGGNIVDGSALSGSASANQVSVMLSNSIVLARDRFGRKAVNSPSRTMFRGKFSLSLRDTKFRYETRPYKEDGCVIDSSVNVIAATGYHSSPYQGPMHLNGVINTDFDFQKDDVGTTGERLSAWELVAATSAKVDIFGFRGKKVIRAVGKPGGDAATVSFLSRTKIAMLAGEVVLLNLCVYAGNTTGRVVTRVSLEFFDGADVSLGRFPADNQYVCSDALKDERLPNYQFAADRWMDTHAWRSVAPKNTAYAKMCFSVNEFGGTLYISRARAWRDV